MGSTESKMGQHIRTSAGCKLRVVMPVVTLGLLLAACILVFAEDHTPTVAADRCEAVRKEMMRKKEELAEYVDALAKSHAKDDYSFMNVLNFKINELITSTKELERELVGCPEPRQVAPPPGMSGIKSDEEAISAKSCEDLKKMLVPLIRKVNSLKRRDKSVFSGLSLEEKSELSKAESELKIVKESLGKKCGTAGTPGSLQRRLRR
jgi:hypothetical protein